MSKVEIGCVCGRRHIVDASPLVEGDQRGELVVLADGWGPIGGATLQRWARGGRLQAYRAERGKWVAWERDIRNAVEVEDDTGDEAPSTTPSPATTGGASSRVASLLRDPQLEVVG